MDSQGARPVRAIAGATGRRHRRAAVLAACLASSRPRRRAALLQAALEEGGAVADEARPLLARAGAVLRPVGPAPSPALVQVREFPQGAPAFVVALADGRFLVSAFAGPWQGALAEPPAVPHPRREVTSSRVAAPKQVQPFGDAHLGFTASDLVLLDRHDLAVDKKIAGGLKRASEKLTCLIAGQAAAYTGDSEGVVRRLDAKHKLVAAKVKHASGVHHLALSADGARLASVAPDGVRVVGRRAQRGVLPRREGSALRRLHRRGCAARRGRSAQGRRARAARVRRGAAPTRTPMPFSPRELVAIDGGRVVIACDEGPLLVVELATGRVVGGLLGHGPQPGGLAWSAALGLVASTSTDGSLRLWDPARAEPVGPLARVDGLAAGGTSLLVDRGDNVEFTVGDATVSVDVTGDELVVRRDGQLAVVRNGQTLHFIAPDGSTRELELDLDVQSTTFLPSGALLAAGPEGVVWIDPAKAKVTSKAAYALTGDLCALGAIGDAEARVITRAGSTAVLAPGKKKPAVTTVELEGGADAEFVLGPDAVATLGSFQAEGQVWSALLARVTYPGARSSRPGPKYSRERTPTTPRLSPASRTSTGRSPPSSMPASTTSPQSAATAPCGWSPSPKASSCCATTPTTPSSTSPPPPTAASGPSTSAAGCSASSPRSGPDS
ncbi:WD40 repeat domain-containing protein [Nannocystis pusilla]|uniref:WD40 repeat domain-containing protein n=1 Tax=Nannocystis pusilla TaxID=889268 RepID=UPI003B7A762B